LGFLFGLGNPRSGFVDHLDEPGARSLLAFFLDNADDIADSKAMKLVIGDAILMEVDLTFIFGLEKTVSLLLVKLRNEGSGPDFRMRFDHTSLAFDKLFELPACGFKGVAKNGSEGLVHVPFAGLSFNHQLVSVGNGHFNAYAKWVSGALVLMRLLDGHTTADHVVTCSLELGDFLADELFDILGFLYSTKRDFQWNLHDFALTPAG
jgi:hypothetical protein